MSKQLHQNFKYPNECQKYKSKCCSSLKFHRCRLIIKTSKSFHMHRSISQPNLLNRDVQAQQQSDAGMSLHEYFKSPEAIQHQKLMQMLQVWREGLEFHMACNDGEECN
ncbi:uncharacterized protein LOC110278305 isoform X1 [Arachis duranensis]|uniref:Uncharacterized protein LOC110278305 isoform X1 n=1 Tax=Arachis duranensis TaxID=130453 RepID=A0A9C6TSA2_ARADU|nr:uncharacterized protein LOC110278305 isoform X1 [Arachis duranensis]